MTDPKLIDFTKDLRRRLYLMEILGFTDDSLLYNPITPEFMKQAIRNTKNNFKHLKGELMTRGRSDAWDTIKSDLNKDLMHDIAVHIDTIADVKNIAEITDIVERLKVEYREKHGIA